VGGETWEGSLFGPNEGSADAFLARYDGDGNQIWGRQFGTSGGDDIAAIDVDADGAAYVTGYSSRQIGPTGDYWGLYLSKFDSVGDQVFVRQHTTPLCDMGAGVVYSGPENVFVAGHRGSGLVASDAVLTRFNLTNESADWTTQWGSTATDKAKAIAAGDTGDLYVAGATLGSMAATGSAGSWDAFLSKLDANGNLQWTRQLGSNASDAANAVGVDPTANIYIAGLTGGPLPNNSHAGGLDAFLAKYDAYGGLLWTRQFGTDGWDLCNALSIDSSGDIYVTGETNGLLGDTSFGYHDGFVAKFQADGNMMWLQQFGTAEIDRSWDIATDLLGNVYVAGDTRGAFGAENAGHLDGFLAKLSIVPEPSTIALLGTAVLGLLAYAWRRRKRR